MTCIYLWGIFMGWESSPWQVSIKENVLVFPPKGVVMVVKGRATAEAREKVHSLHHTSLRPTGLL